jgi:hypothetical protein
VKKSSRAKKAKDIVASVRKEMDKPRLTESVRQALSGHAAVADEKPRPAFLAGNCLPGAVNHKPLTTNH